MGKIKRSLQKGLQFTKKYNIIKKISQQKGRCKWQKSGEWGFR